MNYKQNGNKTKKNSGKRLILGVTALMAAGIMAVGTTALASSEKENFSIFFNGNTEISEGSSTLIHQSNVMAGIKVTIEESIVGGNSAIIIASFENEDGTAFPQDAALAKPELVWKNDASYMVEQRMTADGKKIIVMFDIDTPSSLHGKKVTIKADAVVNSNTDTVIVKGPLKHKFTAQENSTSYNIAIDQTLSQQQEMLSIHNMTISPIGIGIQGDWLAGEGDQLPKYNPKVSIMTSDGKTTDLYVGSTSTIDQGFQWKYNLDQDGNKIFLDTATIISVSIDGTIVQATK